MNAGGSSALSKQEPPPLKPGMTKQGFTTTFREPPEETRPLFISDLPMDDDNLTIFDYYFNLDKNAWVPFSLTNQMNQTALQFGSELSHNRTAPNLIVPT